MKLTHIPADINIVDIQRELSLRLSAEELATFAINLGDLHPDCIDYWTRLYKKSKEVIEEISK